jgi:hypothetical protein
LSVLAALVFLSPRGALVAFAVAAPLAAAAVVAARRARTRAVLALEPPSSRKTAELASLVAVPLLLALAATGPAIRSPVGRGILDNAEAIFVFDTSRSMEAAAEAHAPTRLDQATKVALELRDAVPDVRAGVSSITTQLLPELFPSADELAFAGTVNGAIGVLKPPPPAFQLVATTFDPLGALRDQGFFTLSVHHRVAILLTDGESVKFFPKYVGQRLTARLPTTGFGGGGGPQKPQAPVKLIVLRFGSAHDRIYRSDGTVDPGYRPDLGAPTVAAELAQDAGGLLFQGNQLMAAEKALRKAIGSGPKSRRVTATKTTRLAVYTALASFLPLGLLVWRRNLVAL